MITPITVEGIEDPYFKVNFKKSDLERQWMNVEDPRFINWMKLSSKPDFRKLWGRINGNITAGSYEMKINLGNNQEAKINKKVVFVTGSYFTQKSEKLPMILISLGIAFIFIIFAAERKYRFLFEA